MTPDETEEFVDAQCLVIEAINIFVFVVKANCIRSEVVVLISRHNLLLVARQYVCGTFLFFDCSDALADAAFALVKSCPSNEHITTIISPLPLFIPSKKGVSTVSFDLLRLACGNDQNYDDVDWARFCMILSVLDARVNVDWNVSMKALQLVQFRAALEQRSVRIANLLRCQRSERGAQARLLQALGEVSFASIPVLSLKNLDISASLAVHGNCWEVTIVSRGAPCTSIGSIDILLSLVTVHVRGGIILEVASIELFVRAQLQEIADLYTSGSISVVMREEFWKGDESFFAIVWDDNWSPCVHITVEGEVFSNSILGVVDEQLSCLNPSITAALRRKFTS